MSVPLPTTFSAARPPVAPSSLTKSSRFPVSVLPSPERAAASASSIAPAASADFPSLTRTSIGRVVGSDFLSPAAPAPAPAPAPVPGASEMRAPDLGRSHRRRSAELSLPVPSMPVPAAPAPAPAPVAAVAVPETAAETPNLNVAALQAYLAAESDEGANTAMSTFDSATIDAFYSEVRARVLSVADLADKDPVRHVAENPRSEHVKGAVTAVLNRLTGATPAAAVKAADSPRDSAPAAAPALKEPVEQKSFVASVCERMTSFFSSLANWIASFFLTSSEVKNAGQADNRSLLSEVKEFQVSLNAEEADAEVLSAAYAALCVKFPEAKNAIEYRVYQSAQVWGEDVSSPTFGSDYIKAQPTGVNVKAAIASYVADLEAAAAAVV